MTNLPLQPPSGGCVLKLFRFRFSFCHIFQPPSGGCVLKHEQKAMRGGGGGPAAFGRLCVETK